MLRPCKAEPLRPQPFAHSGLISMVFSASSKADWKSFNEAYAPDLFEYKTWFEGSSSMAWENFALSEVRKKLKCFDS